MDFLEITKQRYATKKFDGKPIPEDKMQQLYEMIRLSASSFGLQPWKIKIVTDSTVKEKLGKASWDQPQVTTCSHLLVFCADSNIDALIAKYHDLLKASGMPSEKADPYIGMMKGFAAGMNDEQKRVWAQKQVYIAMGNALNGAKELGFDSCPMEGFSPTEYSKILGLPENLVPTVVVPVGFASDEKMPKLRFKKEEVFF
ncbi:MAG: NAD(P)H-dependent oxidoreductase [Leptospiraceae bacterium]|nr:NAD(P)H-dependent oxidoreductase [Leptospiraceae bacterium]